MDQKILKFEKEKEAYAKRIADLGYALSIQVVLHRSEVVGLEKKLDEAVIQPDFSGALDVMRITNEAIDEVVDRFLNEAVEKVLKNFVCCFLISNNISLGALVVGLVCGIFY
ncbi:hypothetical protein ACJX0J_033668, partial [Zea mays]